MPEYVLEPTAVYKILLHALKYPAASVCGVLLAKTANKDVVQFSDAIPLLHTPMLSLPTEVALSQVHAHAKSSGLQVMGYYQANQRADDTQLGGGGKKVADVVAATLAPDSLRNHVAAFVVNTAALKQVLQQQQTASIFDVHVADGSKNWQKSNAKTTLPPATDVSSTMQRYLQAGTHTRLVDFEDHLEDIAKNWLNTELLVA